MISLFEGLFLLGLLAAAAAGDALCAFTLWLIFGWIGLAAFPFVLWTARGCFLALERTLLPPVQSRFDRCMPWDQ